ncbi:MAG TPA: hypothetical protein PKK95_02755 [Vicinamibacterales bacterium]|nr:hypothetical protein [Vicinamibacterales bacterium]
MCLATGLQAKGAPRKPADEGAGASARVMRLDDLRRVPRHRLPTIRTYRWAAAAALSVVERELRLPLRGEIVLFSSAEAFRDELAGDGRHAPLPPASSLPTMVGVSTADRICLNLCRLHPHDWPVRIAALAHEMAHVAQYQLAGGRRMGTEQWLREGMAEWVGARVLEVLGEETVASRVEAVRGHLRQASCRSALPRLSDLVSADSWVQLVGEDLEDPMYDVSLVAAAELIDRHGFGALVDYFERFASLDDRRANFRAVFGEDPRVFEERFDRSWR